MSFSIFIFLLPGRIEPLRYASTAGEDEKVILPTQGKHSGPIKSPSSGLRVPTAPRSVLEIPLTTNLFVKPVNRI